MHFIHFKKAAAFIITGMLVCAFPACHSITEKKAEEQTTESIKVKQNNPDYAQEDVILPEDFGNMIYPVEALMVELYSKGLPYFGTDSSDEEKESFWYSMAVLTSQMNHYVRDVAVETDDRYIYIDEETMDIYASAMYDAYARGNIEFPERGENSAYATYDAEKGIYGLRQGTVGDLEPYVTDCQDNGGEYVLTVHLKNKDSVEILSSYEIVIVPTVLENEENTFSYSVKDCRMMETSAVTDSTSEDTEEQEDTEETEETATEEELTEAASEDTEMTTEASTEVSTQEEGISEAGISTEDALDLARDYYGEEAQYTYKDIVTIGDYDYYDFSVEGDDVGATDILISLDGENVMGGTQNSDGSWSFDQ